MKRQFISTCVLLALLGGPAPVWAAGNAIVQQQQTVKGTVVDASGEPLIGVTVQIEGKAGGTVTDIDGNYQISAPKGTQLKFSYIGYEDQTVTVSGAQLNVTMRESQKELQEVVVVGYGSQKKESLTGAVTVVDAKQMESKGTLSSRHHQAGQGGQDHHTVQRQLHG